MDESHIHILSIPNLLPSIQAFLNLVNIVSGPQFLRQDPILQRCWIKNS